MLGCTLIWMVHQVGIKRDVIPFTSSTVAGATADPEVYASVVRINGEEHDVLFWSRQQWERIPEAQRRRDARSMPGGGWFLIELRGGGHDATR